MTPSGIEPATFRLVHCLNQRVYVSQRLMTDVPKVIDVQCSSVFVLLLKNSSSLRCRTLPTHFYTALNLNSVWVGHNSFSFPLISFSCLPPCRSCVHNEFLYISICQGSWLCSLPALRREAFFYSLTLRRLMSYIYIYIYGAPILDVSRSHTTTQHSR